MLEIRKAKKEEISDCYEVIKDAKRVFKKQGSTQWQDLDGYPSLETLQNDFNKDELYLVKDKEIIGVFVFSRTLEKCYENIYEGKWISNTDNYGVLHRIAILEKYRGKGYSINIMNFIDDLAKSLKLDSIKVDTMERNIEMRKLLIKSNYQECGIIYLLRKDVLDPKRIAYENLIRRD